MNTKSESCGGSKRKISCHEKEDQKKKKISPEKSNEETDKQLGSVIAQHYNNISDVGLKERNKSRIVHLRNFHNWIKSMLISKSQNHINPFALFHLKNYTTIDEFVTKIKEQNQGKLSVLDMGCGKGGDLQKWRAAEIGYLVCADIAEVSVEQCRGRYEDIKKRPNPSLFNAEFISADCTKVRLRDRFVNQSLELDLVSCQFSFHYCFESITQAECMIKNASESLRKGGYFIGTIPDANDIVSRYRKTGCKDFGNDIYQIQFDRNTEGTFPLFGAKYDFYLEGVVNCPEFLVHFPTFVRLAEKYGLKLVMKERFQDCYTRWKEEGRSLLGKMSALETYPPFDGVELSGKLEEYAHVEHHPKEGGRIGTLSVPEWQCTTLYLAFAFLKE